MAVKTYDDEEKEQAAQSKSTGGSEWLSGEALAQSQKMKTTTQVVNLSKQTDESAKKIAGRIQNENDRNSFQSEYAYSKSPTYSASEHNILKGLMSTGITHTAGNLNLYEADMDTLVRSVQAIPETERRKSAYAYLKALTKVKDGRFYKAYSFGDTKDPGYLETLDFDKAGYDERVKGYQGIFYLGDGHDEENLRAYVDAYDRIRDAATSDQQSYWYMQALDDAFGKQTGYSAPDIEKARQALFAYDQKNAAQGTGEDKETAESGGFSQFLASIGESIGSIFGGKKEDSAEADTEKESEPTPAVSPLPTPPEPVPEATPQPPQETPAPETAEAEEAPAEVQGPPAPAATPATAASQEAQEPVAAPLEAPEVQGPPAPQQTQAEQQAPAPGSVNLTGDPVRAITQYVKQGRGNELDEETRQAVNDYIGSSKSAQVVMGLDAAGTVGMYEEAENDPFALSRANAARFDLYAGNVSSVIGSTLGGYYARISSESFPDSLRDDALGVLMDVGRAAEEAYRSGAIDVPENGNLYEAYLSANPRALDNLKGAFTTLYEMDKEARKQARQTEEQAALAEKERLDIARAHVRSGDFTAEDYALVEAQAPVISTADAMDDETYADALIELRGAVSASYREEGGWFNEQTESYLRAVGVNVAMDSAVALDYKDTLAGYVQDEMLSDLRVAKALGYDSLGAYYDRQGGMSLDNLYARATLSMESFGQSLTQEDMDAAQALVYQGTGEGVGKLDVLATGIKLGSVSTGSEYYEAIWTMGQNANANRADLQSKVRSEYTKQWGPALAAYMLTQDWLSALDGGATPSEEYAQYVRSYIEGGGDVFLLGPPPSMDSFVLRKAVESDAAVAQTMQYIQENMNASQGRWVDIISNTASNVEMQAMATVVTRLTGSSTLGTALSFGLTEYSPTVREQLANGRTLSQANAMGMAHAATTAIANAPTSGKFTGKIFGALGITPAVVNGAALAGSTAPAKTMAGMIKAFGTGFLKGAGEMAVDELFIDEAKERGLWALASGTGEAMMDGTGVLEAIGAGLAGVDPAQIGQDILADAPEGIVCMLPMIFMGGLSDGVSSVKANWPKTTRAAQKLAQTGTAQAAQEFVAAMNEEIQNPQARQELNDAMRGAAAGQAAAGAMLTDPEIRQKAESAQKAIEQAQSHEATLEAETARREVAREGYEHAKEIGDVDAQLAAMDEYTKASHNMADAQKEAQQKRTEADSLAAQAVEGALKKGEAYAAEERRRTISLIAETGMEYMGDVDSAQDRQIQRRIDELYAEANRAFEAGDEATAEELATQAGYLSVYLDDRQRAREAQTQAERDAILEESRAWYEDLVEKREADAERARSKETEALQRARETKRSLETEKAELGPVFKTLRGKRIYVDDAQRKEILYLTGARNLTEANKMLGTKLTGNPEAEKAVHVDSSWYQDLKALAPGYFSAEWDDHPEYAIVSLGQRMKTLDSRISDAKEQERAALERWQEKVSQTEGKALQEARQIPPGEALSQFENQTYPGSELSSPEAAEIAKGTTHKVHAVSDMQKQAEDRIAKSGLKTVVREILASDRLTDADIYAAQQCLAILRRNGDVALQTALVMKIGTEQSQNAQTLRANREFRAKTVAGAITDTIKAADEYNKRKGSSEKQQDEKAILDSLDSAELSLGSADALTFMEGNVLRATSDPVMQKLGSDVAQRSNGELSVYWADMGENVRGFFDRQRGVIVLNQRIGAAQASYLTALHEFSHYMEGQPGYGQYAEAILTAAYGKGYEDSTAYKMDTGAVRDTYASNGRELTDDELKMELVSQAAEKIITGDEAFQRSMFGTKDAVSIKILAGLDHFINAKAAKKNGPEAAERYNLLRAARSSIRRAIQGAGQKSEGAQSGGVQYALLTETDAGARSGRLTDDRQIRISEPETVDAIMADMPDGDVELKKQPYSAQTDFLRGALETSVPESGNGITADMPEGEIELREQPDGVQTDFVAGLEAPAPEVVERVTQAIDAMQDEDYSTDNRWGLPINSFQREKIREFKLENVDLPGLNYNRATVEQRMLCAILASPRDDLGAGRQTLTQQLTDLENGRLAVVTDADINYILSQAAIVEACDEVDSEGVPLDPEGRLAYARMLEAQANTIPVPAAEKLRAWQYMNMLSAPATTARNVAGNQIMDTVEGAGTALFGQWIDRAVAQKTGTRTVAVSTREERAAGNQARLQGFRNAYNDYFVAKANTSRERKYEVNGQSRVFQNEGLENARNFISFLMEGTDRMMIEKTVSQEMAALERIGAKIRDEETLEMRPMTRAEMQEEAERRAYERFFHEQNSLSRAIAGIMNEHGLGTVARILIPFVKTPSNIALRTFDYSPLGLAKSAIWDGLVMMNVNKDKNGVGIGFDQYRFVTGMTRGLTGTAITAVGYALAQAGVLKLGYGDEDNEKRRNAKRSTGVPYGTYLDIMGSMHEVAWSIPTMAGLEIGLRISELERTGEIEPLALFGTIAASSVNQLVDNSYLQTINQALSGYGSNFDKLMNALATTGESFLTMTFVPSSFRATAKMLDPYVRDTGSDNPVVEVINKTIIQNWPLVRETLPVKYDVTGDAMRQNKAYQEGGKWESGVMNFVDSMVSPTATYSEKDDDALLGLLDLSYRTGETSFLPEAERIENNKISISQTLGKALTGEKRSFTITLTEAETQQLNQLYSSILFGGTGKTKYYKPGGISAYSIQGLRALMASPEWAGMSDEERIKKVTAMKGECRELICTLAYDMTE